MTLASTAGEAPRIVPLDTPLHALPLRATVLEALRKLEVNRLSDLGALSREALLRQNGVGPKTVGDVESLLSQHGVSLKR